ncbi:uncharacterized protein [Populus alba]|uniref:uncharacterized protein n=1 Tax=Populus alba TaxID=43335 RepID=UPI003CC78AA4
MRSALLVRQSFLDLRDNFRRIVDPPLLSYDGKGSKVGKQIVLDGPVNCGESITPAMLVHWAREEGRLVFYVPGGREWTHGGFFYKDPNTGLWDTPLQDFVKYNESHLKQLSCHIFDPVPLGDGIKHTHAAVGVVVRLRKQLPFVKDIPVLFAIDQYSNWFTFSKYEEPVTLRSCRPVHCLRTCSAHNAPATSEIYGVKSFHFVKLRKDLPHVPLDARVNLPRYILDESDAVCHYRHRTSQMLPPRYFSNGFLTMVKMKGFLVLDIMFT